jgi:hypothetical protein
VRSGVFTHSAPVYSTPSASGSGGRCMHKEVENSQSQPRSAYDFESRCIDPSLASGSWRILRYAGRVVRPEQLPSSWDH